MKIELYQSDIGHIHRLERIRKNNAEMLERYANYIRNDATFINKELMGELTKECRISEEEAYGLLFAAACDLNPEDNISHMELIEEYLVPSIKKLDVERYKNNPYYRNIKMPSVAKGCWQFKYEMTKPYEAFIYNDIILTNDFKEIPRLGFFDEPFSFLAVLESGVEWMTITPNELETQQPVIDEVKGKVITFGLGLGYFAYMVSEKEEVEHITIVERDPSVIALFKEYILPQFGHKDKVRIIESDAFTYMQNEMAKKQYDYAFGDIWHDVADGVDLYLQMKKWEYLSPETKYLYWIEDSILSNLRFSVLEVLLDQFKLQQKEGMPEIMKKIGTYGLPDNQYEQNYRNRLKKISKHLKNEVIYTYSDFTQYLTNEYLKKLAKVI